jgi:hypothetical protein
MSKGLADAVGESAMVILTVEKSHLMVSFCPTPQTWPVLM